MKKSCFKVLCMVLIIALLAPNAFAATPTPEAPLADAATVERVKQEIAAGEITDMEDLFLVAYQHLGADLEEEGMTAYINEDGTLGFTQIINNNNTGDLVLYSRENNNEVSEYAVTSVALLDTEGNVQPFSIDTMIGDDSGSLNNISVYVTHTAYIRRNDLGDSVHKFKLGFMVTSISYNLETFAPLKLVQSYESYQNYGDTPQTASLTTNNPARISHTFNPNTSTWYDSGWGITGGIRTTATVTFANTAETLVLSTQFSLHNKDFYYD